jgi:hypothetical protein
MRDMQAHLEKASRRDRQLRKDRSTRNGHGEARLVYQARPALQGFGLRGGARDQECNQEQ